MSAHTRGPWLVNDGGSAVLGPGTAIAVILHAENGGAIDDPRSAAHTCDVLSRRQSVAEAQANARLIAAAPDLYTALKLMRDAFDFLPADDGEAEALDAADAALARARGESEPKRGSPCPERS